MLDVSDLIGIPYVKNGRGLSDGGYDCYGLAIEVEKRIGNHLVDIFYSDERNEKLVEEAASTINVEKTDTIIIGTLLEIWLKGELHIGVAISEELFIHCTYNQGVRVSRISSYPIANKYKVI